MTVRRFTTALIVVAAACLSTAPLAAADTTQLTLSAPASARSGARVVLSGYLVNTNTGRRVYNATINIYYAMPGAKTWTKLYSVETNANGFYSDIVTVSSTAYFMAGFDAVGKFAAARSGQARVTVSAATASNATQKWGTDGCLYRAVSGAWQGQYCMRQATNSSRQALPGQYWVYTFNAGASSHLGQLKFLFNSSLSNSNYLAVRLLNQPSLIAWIAVPLKSGEQGMLYGDVNGRWQWVSVPQFSSAYNAGAVSTNGGTVTSVTVGGGGIPGAFQGLVNPSASNGTFSQLLMQGAYKNLQPALLDDLGLNAIMDQQMTDLWAIG